MACVSPGAFQSSPKYAYSLRNNRLSAAHTTTPNVDNPQQHVPQSGLFSIPTTVLAMVPMNARRSAWQWRAHSSRVRTRTPTAHNTRTQCATRAKPRETARRGDWFFHHYRCRHGTHERINARIDVVTRLGATGGTSARPRARGSSSVI